MLKLRFTNNKQNAVWLVEPQVTLGRSATCDLVLNNEGIAARHADIRVNHEQLQFVLLVDSDETLVNGTAVSKEVPVALKPMDRICIGTVDLQVVDPKQETRSPTEQRQPETTGWALKANHAALGNRLYPLRPETVIGRSNECDITLVAAHLSRRHAQLQVRDGLLYVKDLGSSNGTFVNGKRIDEARLKRGDDLRFDTLSFGIIGPADDLDKTTIRTVGRGAPKSAPARPADSHRPSAVKPAATASRGGPRSRPAAGARAKPVSGGGSAAAATVQTIDPSPRPSGRGGLIGLGLLLIIASASLLAWQNGWLGL